MTIRRFTLVKGWVDTAGRTRTWKLIDSEGRLRCEMTCKRDAQVVIEALNIADLMLQNCAHVGLTVPEHTRYQKR